MPKHIFWPIITVPACIPPFTRGQGAVIRRIGGRGHFRSRDENGGQTIQSAIPENPRLYANFTAVSSTVPEFMMIIIIINIFKVA